jgi:hypothetical protein
MNSGNLPHYDVIKENELLRINSCTVCVCQHCQAREAHDGCMIIYRYGGLEKEPFTMGELTP